MLKVKRENVPANASKRNNWVLSITPKVWRAVERRSAYATRTKTESSRIKRADIVIFYIRGTGRFNCIYEADSKWHEPSGRWPARITDEIDLSIVQAGTASVRSLSTSLRFARRGRWIGLHLRGGLGNYGRPITNRDCNMISDHMKKSSRLLV